MRSYDTPRNRRAGVAVAHLRRAAPYRRRLLHRALPGLVHPRRRTGRELAQYTGLAAASGGHIAEPLRGIIKPKLDRSARSGYALRNEHALRLQAALKDCRGSEFDRGGLLRTVAACRAALDSDEAWNRVRGAAGDWTVQRRSGRGGQSALSTARAASEQQPALPPVVRQGALQGAQRCAVAHGNHRVGPPCPIPRRPDPGAAGDRQLRWRRRQAEAGEQGSDRFGQADDQHGFAAGQSRTACLQGFRAGIQQAVRRGRRRPPPGRVGARQQQARRGATKTSRRMGGK